MQSPPPVPRLPGPGASWESWEDGTSTRPQPLLPPRVNAEALTPVSLLQRSLARQSGPVQAFSPLMRSHPGEQETDNEPTPPRTAKLASSQPVSAPRPRSPAETRTATLRATDTVCHLVSSRIFFPGSHPVRGVQVMKVGKLQLHQGMFPQAMKNLRLVSARMRRSCRCPRPFLPVAGAPFCDCWQLYTRVSHAHSHTHTCARVHVPINI